MTGEVSRRARFRELRASRGSCGLLAGVGGVYCGIDWAALHHDVAIVNDAGEALATRRIGENATGVTTLLLMLAEHVVADAGTDGGEFVAVDVSIETGRGLLVAAARAAGHRVFEINPKTPNRYRDRHAVPGSKTDAGGYPWCWRT